jgi:murein DD-endopeptidase MepM/ murein hydrolase activator NlpD
MYSPPIIQDSGDDDLLDSLPSEGNIPSDQDGDNPSENSDNEQESESQTDSAENEQTDSAIIEKSEPSNQVPFFPSNEHKIKINKGDTITSILENLGFDRTEVYLASKALSKVFNLRNLKIGQEIIIRGEKNAGVSPQLKGLEISPDVSFKIIVKKNNNGSFSAERKDIPIKKVIRSVSGTMSPKNPAYSLKQCGIKTRVALEALRALTQVVNLKAGRSLIDFEFVYYDFYDNEGNIIPKKPELLYAMVLIDGNIKKVYNFKDGNHSEYIDSTGTILKTLAKSKSLLSHPIDRMKITSRFGMRRHPISGKWRGHSGVDLSASVGTPVRAAANGTVQKASYYSGYGRYVNIKHTASINTAYAHLSRITVRSGQQIHQGQIIGYSGSSGSTTGAHLHYEVIRNGRYINPLAFVKREPQKLSGQRLAKFNRFKKEINLQIVGLSHPLSTKKKTVRVLKKYS